MVRVTSNRLFFYVVWLATSLLTGCSLRSPQPDYLYASTFETGNILDLKSLAARLEHPSPTDRVSAYLHRRLSVSTQELLSQYNNRVNHQPQLARSEDIALRHALVEDLNRIVRSGLIFEPNRFAGVQLSSATAALLRENPEGDAVDYLNRLLIQDAYAVELSTNKVPDVADPASSSPGAVGRSKIRSLTKEEWPKLKGKQLGMGDGVTVFAVKGDNKGLFVQHGGSAFLVRDPNILVNRITQIDVSRTIYLKQEEGWSQVEFLFAVEKADFLYIRRTLQAFPASLQPSGVKN